MDPQNQIGSPFRQRSLWTAIVLSYLVGALSAWLLLSASTPPVPTEAATPPASAPKAGTAGPAAAPAPRQQPSVPFTLKLPPTLAARLAADTRFTASDLAYQEKVASLYAANELPAYDAVFAELGLSPAQTAELKSDLEQIRRTKIEAHQLLAHCEDHRLNYDKKLQRLLGDRYADYRQYEAGSKARREVGFLDEFARNSAATLDAADRTRVQDLIRETSAYSQLTVGAWGGPYDEVPLPASGKEAVSRIVTERYAAFQDSMAALGERLDDAGLSPAGRALVESYYRHHSEGMDDLVLRIENPRGAMIDRYQRRLDALRADPTADPERIRSLERILDAQRRPSK